MTQQVDVAHEQPDVCITRLYQRRNTMKMVCLNTANHCKTDLHRTLKRKVVPVGLGVRNRISSDGSNYGIQ